MEIVIYADILFALNFLMDIIILFFTSILTRTDYKIYQLTVSAILLALYGTLAFNPVYNWISSVPVRLAVSAAAISVFGIKRGFFKRYIVFWASSILIGGAVFAAAMSTGIGQALKSVAINGNLYIDADIRIILAGILLSYVLIFLTKKICTRSFGKDKILLPITLRLWGRDYKLTSLIDTGCELTLPLTDEGVLLVSKELLKVKSMPEPYLFLTISTASGNDKIPIYYPERIKCLNNSYTIDKIPPVGIVNPPLARDGLYNSILNPIILTGKAPVNHRKEVVQ